MPIRWPRGARRPAPALDSWWTGFDDPALTRIVQRALDQNLDLAAALARVQQARAVAAEAGAQLLPQGNLSAQAVKERQSLESPLGKIGSQFPGYNRNFALYDVGAGASWEIDLFGGLRRGGSGRRRSAGRAGRPARGAHLGRGRSGRCLFPGARRAAAHRHCAGPGRDQLSGCWSWCACACATGLSSSREVAQAEALVAQARVTIPPLRIELQTRLNRLDVLMGAQPGTYAAELGPLQEAWRCQPYPWPRGPPTCCAAAGT
ncbi:TolC family protein [Cupriavidus basilensis]